MSIDGRRRRVRLRRAARPVAAGAEELVEHVVLVRRDDQLRDRQTHLRATWPARMLPKLPDGTAKLTARRCASRGEVAVEVVDDLRGDARPVDRVDRAEEVARLERRIAGDGLDDVLAIVERALDREVVDVRIVERVHLRLLERAHPAVRRQHEHGEVALAAHRVLGGAAGVARCRAQDVERPLASRSTCSNRLPSSCSAMSLNASVGPFDRCSRCSAGLQCRQRRDPRIAERRGRVRPHDDRAQVVRRNVGDEMRQHGERELRIRLVTQRASASRDRCG